MQILLQMTHKSVENIVFGLWCRNNTCSGSLIAHCKVGWVQDAIHGWNRVKQNILNQMFATNFSDSWRQLNLETKQNKKEQTVVIEIYYETKWTIELLIEVYCKFTTTEKTLIGSWAKKNKTKIVHSKIYNTM